MIYRYEIKNNGKEDILYLYVTMTYEFSDELNNNQDKNIQKKCEKFIENNSINFQGNKIYLVINGIIVKTINLNEKEKIEEEKEKKLFSNNEFYVTIRFENDRKIKISLKEYLLGVIATNTIKDLELTTLKALCLLYRTYAYKQMKEKKYIDAINKYQIYKPISYYKVAWINNYNYYYNKISKAIEDTDKEFITYQNNYINPHIHITNNGYTDTLKDVPYLEKRSSLWDYASPYYLEIKDYTNKELENILKIKSDTLKQTTIIEVSESNYIKKIKVGEKIYTGKEIKENLNLKSTDITIIINPTCVRFITKGWGNNLGISQFGANEIAKAGCSYTSIIKYYFPSVAIKKYI